MSASAALTQQYLESWLRLRHRAVPQSLSGLQDGELELAFQLIQEDGNEATGEALCRALKVLSPA